MIWPRRPAVFFAGLVAVSFGTGVVVGARFFQRPVIYREIPPPPISNTSESPVQTGMQPACIDFRNASSLIGKNGCVSGAVLRIYAAPSGNTFFGLVPEFSRVPLYQSDFCKR